MSVDDELRGAFLTEALSDVQRSQLEAAGEEQSFTDGQTLFVEGEPASSLWILLEGEIDLSRNTGGEDTVMATMTTPVSGPVASRRGGKGPATGPRGVASGPVGCSRCRRAS